MLRPSDAWADSFFVAQYFDCVLRHELPIASNIGAPFILPFGVSWASTVAELKAIFAPLNAGARLPLQAYPRVVPLGGLRVQLSWPGVLFELMGSSLVMIDFAFASLGSSAALCYLYRELFLLRVQSRHSALAALLPHTQFADAVAVAEEAPLYSLCVQVMRDCARPLKASAIAAGVQRLGHANVTTESVVAALQPLLGTTVTRNRMQEYTLRNGTSAPPPPLPAVVAALPADILALPLALPVAAPLAAPLAAVAAPVVFDAPAAVTTIPVVVAAPAIAAVAPPPLTPVTPASAPAASAAVAAAVAPLAAPMDTGSPDEEAKNSSASAAGPASPTASAAMASLMGRKPYLYELAYRVLLQEQVPLHYKEIAVKITEQTGSKTTGDQVLGAIGGWYAHAGSEYLERTGPGKYGVRPGKIFTGAPAVEDAASVGVDGPTSPSSANAAMAAASQTGAIASPIIVYDGAPVSLLTSGAGAVAAEPRTAPSPAVAATPLHNGRGRDGTHGELVRSASAGGASGGSVSNGANVPFYQLAQDLLRERRTPMHYREIAAALRATGRDVHQDTIMGSLNGYINTTAGKAVLVRVGKGTYTLKEFVKSGVVSVGPDGLALPPGSATAPAMSQAGRTSATQPLVDPKLEDELAELEKELERGGGDDGMGSRKRSLSRRSKSTGDNADDMDDNVDGAGDDDDGFIGGENGDMRATKRKLSDDQEMLSGDDSSNGGFAVANYGNADIGAFNILDRDPNELPTFLLCYYVLKEPGNEMGFSVRELAQKISARGVQITTERLNSRMSAYTSYRRKKNMPQVFDRKAARFSLSAYGRRISNDPHSEAEFLRTIFARGK